MDYRLVQSDLFLYHKVYGDVLKGWRFFGSEEHWKL